MVRENLYQHINQIQTHVNYIKTQSNSELLTAPTQSANDRIFALISAIAQVTWSDHWR